MSALPMAGGGCPGEGSLVPWGQEEIWKKLLETQGHSFIPIPVPGPSLDLGSVWHAPQGEEGLTPLVQRGPEAPSAL